MSSYSIREREQSETFISKRSMRLRLRINRTNVKLNETMTDLMKRRFSRFVEIGSLKHALGRGDNEGRRILGVSEYKGRPSGESDRGKRLEGSDVVDLDHWVG